MDMRRKLEERIRKKEAEVEELRTKIHDAEVALETLHEVRRMLPREPGVISDAVLRAGSMVADARIAILKAGKPLHIVALLTAMGREPTRENRTSLAGSMAAYVRDSKIFTRPAPNTFGLIELNQEDKAADGPEPPSNFGEPEPTIPSTSKDIDDEIPF